MKITHIIPTLGLCVLTSFVTCKAQSNTMPSPVRPGVVTMCPDAFVRLKRDTQINPNKYQSTSHLLKEQADKAMTTSIRAITDKTVKGPSSDPHDYVSLSPYRWPNPDTADGMPWIRKDGKVNPMRDQYDLPAMESMSHTVLTLATGYYFLDNEAYTKRAVQLIDMWFVDPVTRMNPRVAHGQFIPGKTDGQCFGILETARLFFVINAAGLLEGSSHWTPAKRDALKQWFTDYLHWLQTSDLGKAELAQPNNHSNWIICQMMVFAIFTGDENTAMKMVDLAKRNIDTQINADGSQPHELSRTRSLDYSEFSLRALLTVAWLAKPLGSDLASYTNAKGGSLQKAIDMIAPHLPDPTHWPHKQIATPKYRHFNNTLGMAQSLYPDHDYQQYIDRLPAEDDPTAIYFEPPFAYHCSEK